MDEIADPTRTADNATCRKLGIAPPDLARVKVHREANTYALLIVALIERGEPMTLVEVADRFAEAGVAPRDRALLSLKRCKPARPPVYRDGDRYALDLDDDELGLWLFRLELRPPRAVPPRPAPAPEVPSRPGAEVPLSIDELATAWRGNAPWSFSRQRLAVAVLDAQGGAMPTEEAIAFATTHAGARRLSPEAAQHWRTGAPVRATRDGRWVLDAAHPAVAATRNAVRDRVEMERKWEGRRQDPAEFEAWRREWERRRAENARALARLRRVIVHAVPPDAPEAAVLVDVAERRLDAFVVQDGPAWLGEVRERLASYDVIAGLGVRALARGLGFDAGERRLVDLGPPQKSLRLNRRGRTLKITIAMLIQGSCGIARPLGEPARLREYLRGGDRTRLLRRLAADAKSLYWLHEYGRLHGAARLRWGFLDEMFAVPWCHRDETLLHDLCELAVELGVALEVVAGSAPGWAEPWARMRRVVVERRGYDYLLWDQEGRAVDERDVQLARLEAVERTLH